MKKSILALVLFAPFLFLSEAFAIADGEGNYIFPGAVRIGDGNSPTTVFEVVGSTSNRFKLTAPTAEATPSNLDASQWSLWLDEDADKIHIAALESNGTSLLSLAFKSGFDTETDIPPAYTAGNGLDLVGTQFSTDATTCLSEEYSYWTGTAWVCRDDLQGVETISSDDPNQLSIGGTAADVTINLNMGSITNGGTNLATADTIYDFVMGEIDNVSPVEMSAPSGGCSASNVGYMWHETGRGILACIEISTGNYIEAVLTTVISAP